MRSDDPLGTCGGSVGAHDTGDGVDFVGAKAAVFIGERLLVLLRDDKPGLIHPGKWDFVGGGRHPGETPEETLAREMEEEVGLDLGRAQTAWRRRVPSSDHPGQWSWFFVLRMPEAAVRDILFGDEGQAWALLEPDRLIADPDAIPALVARLQMWRDEAG